jgi:hypothetical protein
MVWPTSDVSSTNADAGTDNPATFRADVLDLIQKFNQLRNHAPAYMQGVLASADAAAARTALAAAQSGVNNDITNLQALTVINPSVGFGTVPNAWNPVRPAVQLTNGSFASLGGPWGQANILSNAYTPDQDVGSAVWKYVRGAMGDLGAAGRYGITGRDHFWQSAVPGLADGTITWITHAALDGTSGVLSVPAGVSSTTGFTGPGTGITSLSNTTVAANLNATGSAPMYACRAWVNFNGSGVVAIRASGNVTSITDNGVGDYTVNFTTAMPDANYSITGTSRAQATGAVSAVIVEQHFDTAQTTSAVRIAVKQGGSFVDSTQVTVNVFR